MSRKVTQVMIDKMNDLHSSGYNYSRIAKLMGLSNPTVQSYVKTGKYYSNSTRTKKTTKIGSLRFNEKVGTSYTTTAPSVFNVETSKVVTGKELVEAINLVRSFGIKVEF